MKNVYLLIGVPVFVFLALAGTLDLQTLVQSYPRYDSTAYLAARSLASDLDLACTAADSDRFLRESGRRPSGFRVADRRVLFASGEFRTYPVFYEPDLFVYIVTPFAGFLGFSGWLLLHALLMAALYTMGYQYYRGQNDTDALLPAVNSVLFYTLLPLPILVLLPTHHLYLFVLLSAVLFFGLRGKPVVSALLLGLAFSSQPWTLLVAALLVSYWQYSGLRSEFVRFLPVLGASVAVVWGLEFLMYPGPDISLVRRVLDPLDSGLASLSTAVPEPSRAMMAVPSLQRVVDFLFGRTSGFFVYGIAAGCVLLYSLWVWRDRLVNRTLLYVVLLLAVIACTDPSGWRPYGFVSDAWILMAVPFYFAAPIAKPRNMLIPSAVLCSLLVGPLLVNPLGAWTSRNYYLQSFPYRWFPIELTQLGREGITSDPAYQFDFAGGRAFFLNDQFYAEPEFFWVHGGSELEFLLRVPGSSPLPRLEIVNGLEDNQLKFRMGRQEERLNLRPSEKAEIRLASGVAGEVAFEGYAVLHGTIRSSSGFVPKLLSRENPDYRYLGFQVRILGQ